MKTLLLCGRKLMGGQTYTGRTMKELFIISLTFQIPDFTRTSLEFYLDPLSLMTKEYICNCLKLSEPHTIMLIKISMLQTYA